MKKLVLGLFLVMGISTTVYAKSVFCSGFETGYKSVCGKFRLVPLCPLKGIVPLGLTEFQYGIRMGVAKGLQGCR